MSELLIFSRGTEINLFLEEGKKNKTLTDFECSPIFAVNFMLVEAIVYYGMRSEIGNGACKCHDQYGPQKRLTLKNVNPLAC